MENYSRVEKLQQEGLNATGALMEANENRVNSLKGKFATLTDTVNRLFSEFLQSETLGAVVDGLDKVLNGVIYLIEHLEITIPLVVALGAAWTAIKWNSISSDMMKVVASMSEMVAKGTLLEGATVAIKGGLVGLAAGTVTAGFMAIYNHAKQTQEAIDGLASSVVEMENTVSSGADAAALITQYRDAAKELETLTEGTEEQRQKQEEVNKLRAELVGSNATFKSILDDENASLDEQYQKMRLINEMEMKDKIQDLIDKQPKNNSFFGHDMTEVVAQYNNAIGLVEGASIKLKNIQDEIAKQEALETSLINSDATKEEVAEVRKVIDDLYQRETEQKAKLEEFYTRATGKKTEIDNYNELIRLVKQYNGELDGRVEITENRLLANEKQVLATATELIGAYDEIGDEVEGATDNVEGMKAATDVLAESTYSVKQANEDYLEALEGLEEAQKLIDSFADGLNATELRDVFDSELMADYNGSLNDTANMLDHINNKMQEMKDKSYEASVAMVLNNNDAWNSMTADMANSLNIQEQGFQDFVNSLGGMREVDIQNAQNSADAQLKAEMNLVGQGAMYYAGFVNSKAGNRETDMNNVLDFLNSQGVAEAQTIEQLAQLWAEYYKAKKAEITDTIDKMAGDYGDLGNVDPALMKKLHDLQRLNNNMNNYFANINTNFGGIGTGLSQATANAGSAIANATKPGGSGSSGNKGSSSSSSKEVEDLDLQIDRYYDLQDAIDDTNNALEKNQTLQERATGTQKAKLMKEEIQLYKDLQKATQDLVKEQQKERDELKKQIESQGGKFDSNGDLKDRKKWLERLQAQVNKLSGDAKEAKKAEVENLMSIIEKYEELHNDTIPATQLEYENLANTIKDLQEEQLQYVTDLQKDITSAIENELQKRTDAVKTELEKQKELYDSQYDEENWERELATEQRKLDEIQQQIDNAMRDTSLAGQLYLQQLREEYAAQEESLNEMIRDKEHELGQNRFNEEMNRIEKEEEETLDAENIADLVNKAIATGFVSIGDETIQLNKLMSDWLDETGDGLYAIGDLLKSEMIDNLQTAKTLMQDLGVLSISGSSLPLASSFSIPEMDNESISRARGVSNNVSFGSLLTVEGNVTEDVLPQLQNMISQSEKQITNSIMKALTFS